MLPTYSYNEVDFDDRSLNNQIMQTSNEVWRCVYCCLLFQSKIKLKTHFSEHNSEKLDCYADKCCCSCGKYFSKFHYFENHLLQSGHMNNSKVVIFGSSFSPQNQKLFSSQSTDENFPKYNTNHINNNIDTSFTNSFHSSNISTVKDFGVVYLKGNIIDSFTGML